MSANHTIHSLKHHFGWDNSNVPIVKVISGETIEIDTVDSSGAQLSLKSNIEDVRNLDFSKVNPVTGPIFIEDACEGDVIEIEFIDFVTSGWGWTAIIPGFGLLADEFQTPDLNLWKYEKNNPIESVYSTYGKIPLKPFVGTIGLALKESGNHSVVPPRDCGGNLDIKELSKGSKVRLPVQVSGGLLSLGDTHAAQGDGEVCGTAIESPMKVIVKVNLIKNFKIQSPQFETFGPVSNHIDKDGYFVTTGIGPDLIEGARNSIRHMIDLLVQKHNIPDSKAYMFCSVCADLRISEVVDAPNWVVSCYFPKSVFN
ncbi:MAG: acetamidase/formamidase family protein [SAR202 cluster bacterium]|jgi:formamidase|nr:acetamidase/formamidase family protein [SAR202 cluster bacterium]|tara:strand:- start:35 stop:973 length:939 start_codon:yes stop_codon:yes gene_type:complete